MSYEALHPTEKKLREKILDKFLRCHSRLFELIDGGIVASQMSVLDIDLSPTTLRLPNLQRLADTRYPCG